MFNKKFICNRLDSKSFGNSIAVRLETCYNFIEIDRMLYVKTQDETNDDTLFFHIGTYNENVYIDTSLAFLSFPINKSMK